MTEFSVIGKSFPMVDAREKVPGTADYTADLLHPRLHEAAILRSPHAHARILNIDASKALRLPGVQAVLTGEDTPKIPWGQIYREHYILAVGKVRFIGEEVAAVVANDADTAEEALELGIPAVLLFGLPSEKVALGTEAYAEDGVVQEAVRPTRDHDVRWQ